MVDAWGGWELFQQLLRGLDAVAHKHKASIANVATRYILDQPMVAGVIIGARLGVADHRDDNLRALALTLDSNRSRRHRGCARAIERPLSFDRRLR